MMGSSNTSFKNFFGRGLLIGEGLLIREGLLLRGGVYTVNPRSNIPATGSHMILQERCGKVTGSHRKAPEIAGSGSSIPTGNLLDFFPVDSDQFPVLSSRNRSEIIGKNPKIFRLEYCFHVPVTSGAFLPEPARIFRPGIAYRISQWDKNVLRITLNYMNDCDRRYERFQTQLLKSFY